jgi:hypothetical protein
VISFAFWPKPDGKWCVNGEDMILVKDGDIATLSVPDHREVAKGTLRGLIRSSGLSMDEFLELLRK